MKNTVKRLSPDISGAAASFGIRFPSPDGSAELCQSLIFDRTRKIGLDREPLPEFPPPSLSCGFPRESPALKTAFPHIPPGAEFYSSNADSDISLIRFGNDPVIFKIDDRPPELFICVISVPAFRQQSAAAHPLPPAMRKSKNSLRRSFFLIWIYKYSYFTTIRRILQAFGVITRKIFIIIFYNIHKSPLCFSPIFRTIAHLCAICIIYTYFIRPDKGEKSSGAEKGGHYLRQRGRKRKERSREQRESKRDMARK